MSASAAPAATLLRSARLAPLLRARPSLAARLEGSDEEAEAALLDAAAAGDCALLPLVTWLQVRRAWAAPPPAAPEAARSQETPTPPEGQDPYRAGIRAAHAQIVTSVQETCPEVGAGFAAWTTSLTRGAPPEDYFTHPDAFPTLWLPYVLERALDGEKLAAGLLRSSVAGYYAIRIMDNLMDGDATVEAALLPALAPLSALFVQPLREQLGDDLEFQALFDEIWTRSAEATILDGELDDVDEATFVGVSARKVEAALIPVVAVCRAYGQPQRVPRWSQFLARYGAWHQLANDTRDWQRDHQKGRLTWLLAEGRRRRAAGEGVELWIVREGHDWATAQLDRIMAECRSLAADLDCPPVIDFLDARSATEQERRDQAEPGLALARSLLRLLR